MRCRGNQKISFLGWKGRSKEGQRTRSKDLRCVLRVELTSTSSMNASGRLVMGSDRLSCDPEIEGVEGAMTAEGGMLGD